MLFHVAGFALAIAYSGLAVAEDCFNSSSVEGPDKSLVTSSDDVHILNSNGTGAIIILDYGHSVEGIPSFEVLSSDGDTGVFEISYAESKAAFDEYMVNPLITITWC